MILASKKPNGKVVYFDAATGKQYKPDREKGRKLGRIPDGCFRFLTQYSPRVQNIPANGNPQPADQHRQGNALSQKPTRSRFNFWNWLKSLFNGRKKQ